MRRCFALLVSTVAVLCTLPVEAQERKGFWFDFGVGTASAGLSGDGSIADDERIWSSVASLGLGWALRPTWLVGVDFRLVPLEVTGDIVGDFDVYNVMATVAYYPRASSGFFVKGGIGGGFVDLTFDEQGSTFTTTLAKGLGLSGRVGYDFYIGRGFSVTPSAGVWYGRTGDLEFVGQTLFANWRHDVIDATISISFH